MYDRVSQVSYTYTYIPPACMTVGLVEFTNVFYYTFIQIMSISPVSGAV